MLIHFTPQSYVLRSEPLTYICVVRHIKRTKRRKQKRIVHCIAHIALNSCLSITLFLLLFFLPRNLFNEHWANSILNRNDYFISPLCQIIMCCISILNFTYSVRTNAIRFSICVFQITSRVN